MIYRDFDVPHRRSSGGLIAQLSDETQVSSYLLLVNTDAHVKSPFHMNLGIRELRNYELFKSVTSALILEDGQIVTFYETINLGTRIAGNH